MYQVYQIKMGDTLEKIANKIGSSIEVLAEINGLSANQILIPGSMIVVPTQKSLMFDVYKVKTGDTLYNIARQYGVDLNDLLLLNGLDKNDFIYPDQEIVVPKKDVSLYLTKEGDTLNIVAYNLNTTPLELSEQNASIYLLPNQMILYKKEKNR